ncbi:MAG: hypothetical protein HUU55_20315 [Myxococcales bacterium]|nr:hypothetical protein [Myxococcales bacterium]
MTGIKRALISVSDKTGVTELARALAGMGVEILSTGGTASALRAAGIAVTDVSKVTGFPEIMDGRVKTLHPAIHGGLLARRDRDSQAMAQHAIRPIDLAVINLYPFEATVAKPGCSREEAIENIDIGGPAMIRAAAKNHAFVAVVVDPADYAGILAELGSNAGALNEATRRRPNVLLDGPFASVPKAATLTGLSALLHHLAQGEAALAKGPLTPKIVGQMLFQLLFGDKSDHQPVLATLFADPAGTPTSPNRGPVRCRLVTTDPDLMRLPWRLLVWNDTFLTLDQGWSVELFDPRDAQTNVELSGPPRVLLIVSDPDGALGGDQHIAGWKSLFSTLSPKFSETPHAWLRFARTQTELDRLLKHGRIQPEVVYYFGYCSSHGAQANPVLHLGMGGGGQGEVRLQEIIDSLPPSVRLLYLNGFCRNHAGLPPVCTAGAVPCVVYPTVSTHPHRAADAALQWFGAMVRHAADPVTALSLIPRNLRTTATEALSVRTAYRSWTTGETLTVDYRGNAENHLDRDDQRTKLNHHVGGLIKSPEQTMELFVAYGDEHQHMAGLGSLLFRYVETERDPVALIRYRRLLFPNKTERTGAVDALTHRLTGMFSGDTAAGAIHHVFDKVATVPGKRFVVFLDWGVHGEAETDKLTLDELEALWTWHTQVLASSLTPKEIAVVALLTFERPGPSHVRFRTALDTLRQKSGVQSTRCPITILDPLASVDEDHVTRFLSNNQWSGCGSTRAPRAAAVILRRTGGVFKKACEEIDHAETIGWDSYLADNEAPTATPVPTTQPLDGSTTI